MTSFSLFFYRIIQNYALREESGTMTLERSDLNKVRYHHWIQEIMLSTLQLISIYLCDILTEQFHIACWDENFSCFSTRLWHFGILGSRKISLIALLPYWPQSLSWSLHLHGLIHVISLAVGFFSSLWNLWSHWLNDFSSFILLPVISLACSFCMLILSVAGPKEVIPGMLSISLHVFSRFVCAQNGVWIFSFYLVFHWITVYHEYAWT